MSYTILLIHISYLLLKSVIFSVLRNQSFLVPQGDVPTLALQDETWPIYMASCEELGDGIQDGDFLWGYNGNQWNVTEENWYHYGIIMGLFDLIHSIFGDIINDITKNMGRQ